MNVRHASSPKETQEGPPQLAPHRDFVTVGSALSLLLGFAGACRVAPRTMKEGHKFFDPSGSASMCE